MSAAYRIFMVLLFLMLLLGAAVLGYGLANPSSLPQLAPRNVCAVGYIPHG